jgi:hypothetical protein
MTAFRDTPYVLSFRQWGRSHLERLHFSTLGVMHRHQCVECGSSTVHDTEDAALREVSEHHCPPV